MSAPSAQFSRAHLGGLVFAIALAAVAVLCARLVAWPLRGSIVEELGWLTSFGVIVAVLAIGETLWQRLASWLDPAIGQK